MKKIFVALLFLSMVASASHLSDLMTRYKNAPQSQKYKIMNQIKLEIARLHKSKQRKAIRKLRHIVNSSEEHSSKPKSRKSSHSSSRSRGSNNPHSSHSTSTHHNSASDAINDFHQGAHDAVDRATGHSHGGSSSHKSGSSHSGDGGSSHHESSGSGFSPGDGFAPGGGF